MTMSCRYACIPSDLEPKTLRIVRIGYFYRKSEQKYVRRYRCNACGRSFSSETMRSDYRQRKRHVNRALLLAFASGESQRRLALTQNLNRKTVVRKFRYLAERCRIELADWRKKESQFRRSNIQFDDLETAEHTKCKPVSVAIAVDSKLRKVLSFQVSRMPAKGRLAKISLRKYGPRKDDRPKGWERLMREMRPLLHPNAELLSDENPHYGRFVRKHFPEGSHKTVKSRRAHSGSGQGEIKKGYDPIFSLNHTCAMMRANMNRFFRRTWNIAKNIKGIEDHLAIYVYFHNEVLTEDDQKAALRDLVLR